MLAVTQPQKPVAHSVREKKEKSRSLYVIHNLHNVCECGGEGGGHAILQYALHVRTAPSTTVRAHAHIHTCGSSIVDDYQVVPATKLPGPGVWRIDSGRRAYNLTVLRTCVCVCPRSSFSRSVRSANNVHQNNSNNCRSSLPQLHRMRIVCMLCEQRRKETSSNNKNAHAMHKGLAGVNGI